MPNILSGASVFAVAPHGSFFGTVSGFFMAVGGEDFAPRVHLAMPGDIFGRHD